MEVKKLNKLEINPEKIIKNAELITLKGGYACTCACEPGGYYVSETGDCAYDCYMLFGGAGWCEHV